MNFFHLLLDNYYLHYNLYNNDFVYQVYKEDRIYKNDNMANISFVLNSNNILQDLYNTF